MRITNKMMTNNMLSNINNNKNRMSKLEQQYSSGKKIQKPSDDPIITSRALKLRTNLTELGQYYEKNIPDAKSWMDVTESSLQAINEMIGKMNTYCVQGSSDTLTAEDRDAVVENLSQFKNQIYEEGNSNYAGRYVFTGYKTNSPLIFSDEIKDLNYLITEKFKGTDLQITSKVSGSYELSDYEDPAETFSNAPQLLDRYRLQLAYDDLVTLPVQDISLNYSKPAPDGTSVPQPVFEDVNTISLTDPLNDPYQPPAGEVNFIPETGELIFSAEAYEEFRTADNIEIGYNKSHFLQGDLKPEHYFDCTVTDLTKPELEPVNYKKAKQPIDYEVNYNQKLTINTEGSDAINHNIGRTVNDILKAVHDVENTEGKIAEVEKRLQDLNLTEADKTKYQNMLEQLNTELDLKKEIMQRNFEKGITITNNQQDKVNVAIADAGSRYVRLELTENRLSDQKVDFEDLLSTNEDADLADTLINYNAAGVIYNSSLSAASKVVQNTLLDFL